MIKSSGRDLTRLSFSVVDPERGEGVQAPQKLSKSRQNPAPSNQNSESASGHFHTFSCRGIMETLSHVLAVHVITRPFFLSRLPASELINEPFLHFLNTKESDLS